MRFKRSIIVLLILFLVGNAIVLLSKKTPRSLKTLSQMSLEERYCLAAFLRGILFSDDLAYLLFGSKPIATADFEKTTAFRFSRHWLTASDTTINKGLEVFKKNQHLFSSDNIIVCLEEDANSSDLLMINKKNLLRMLEEHIEDFKQVLGPETTSEGLFTQITEKTGQDNLVRVIKYHEALYGILLGYGRGNAWLFHEYSTLSRILDRFEPPEYIKRDSALEARFNEIDQNTDSFSEDLHEDKYILKSPHIPLPHFRADPNSLETIRLKERYEKERKEMKMLFAKQSYVEATLQKLMDE